MPSPSLPFNYHIRPFQQRDLLGSHDVLLSTVGDYGERFRGIFEHFINTDMSDIQKHYIDIKQSNFWCAIEGRPEEDTGVVIGIVGVRPLSVASFDYYTECLNYEDPEIIPFDPRTTAELNRLAVSPRVRYHGIARALIDTLVAWCFKNSYEFIHLVTSSLPSSASKFYLRCGFFRYRISRHCYENYELKHGNQEAKLFNDQLRLEGRGQLLESKFNVSADEIPDDSDIVSIDNAKKSAVAWMSHFYLPINKPDKSMIVE